MRKARGRPRRTMLVATVLTAVVLGSTGCFLLLIPASESTMSAGDPAGELDADDTEKKSR